MQNRFIIFFLFILPSIAIAQDYKGYGFYVGIASAMHTNFDPTMPEDGTTQWNPLLTFSTGLFKQHSLTTRLRMRHSLGYIQTGYTEFAQVTIIIPGFEFPLTEGNFRNKLHNISYETMLNYTLNPSKAIKVSPTLGLEHLLLVNKTIESDTHPLNVGYPVNQFEDNWNTYRLNWKIGLNIELDQRVNFDFTYANSLSPVLRTETLVVRDWIWTARLNIILI